MLLEDLRRQLTSNGFRELKPLSSNAQYTNHLFYKDRLVVKVEEAHSYNLTGEVNDINVAGVLNEEQDSRFKQLTENKVFSGAIWLHPPHHCFYLGIHPRHFKAIEYILDLFQLNFQNGIVKLWESTTEKYVELSIDVIERELY